MRNIIEIVANTAIPVPYSIWIISRLILIAAASYCVYMGITWIPYSWTNLMLCGMGIYVLFAVVPNNGQGTNGMRGRT